MNLNHAQKLFENLYSPKIRGLNSKKKRQHKKAIKKYKRTLKYMVNADNFFLKSVNKNKVDAFIGSIVYLPLNYESRYP